jgi:hypothetical protein
MMTDEIDEYLQGIMNRPIEGEVFYTYTPQEEAARADIIKLIEAEKMAYLARVEPLLQQLGKIKGRPNFIIKTGLR